MTPKHYFLKSIRFLDHNVIIYRTEEIFNVETILTVWHLISILINFAILRPLTLTVYLLFLIVSIWDKSGVYDDVFAQ